jgi:hypothetical protein
LSKDLGQRNTSSWCNFIKDIAPLLECTYSELMASRKNIKTNTKLILQSRYERFWRLQVGDGSQTTGKLATYTRVKSSFRTENYLADVTNRQHRYALTRLRISAHHLYIERGRYLKPMIPREKRFCSYCQTQTMNLIEDEQHFLLTCPQYMEIRQDMFTVINQFCQYFPAMTDTHKLIYLLTAEDSTIRAVAKCCHDGFQQRNSSTTTDGTSQMANTQTDN